MNKKKIALEVFNTSEIKKIASLKTVDKAALIRMIAEEVSRSSIEEAMTPEQKKVNSSIQNYLSRKLAKNPDQWVQAVKDANNGTLAISGFDQLDDELKKFAIEKFFAASRTKEYLAQQTANIAQTKDVPAEEAAKAVLDLAAPEESTPEAAEELADIADPSGETKSVEIKPLLDKFATFIQRTGVINENMGEVLAALDIKDTTKWVESYRANFSDEEREALQAHFKDDANGELFFKQYFSKAPEFLERFKKLLAGEEEEPAEPSAIEIKPLLDRFATFIQRTGVLNEKINYVIQALDLKDTKVFGKSFAQNFKREEIEALKVHFEDIENGALFFKQYFSEDPEFLERFNQALAGEEEAGEEQEEPKQPPAEEIMDIPEAEIQKLSKAYQGWLNGFMTVKTLLEQSKIFGNLWEPVKIFAGKAKSDMEQAQRAINPATASREEDEAARNEPMQEAAPEVVDAAMADRDAARERAGMSDDSPEEETPELAPSAGEWAENWEQQSGEQAPPEEVKEEFKRSVLESLLVLKRHSDSIADILQIYEKYKGKLTVGSIDAFRKYGDSNPKTLLYKFVNLLMKDINGLLQIMSTLQPEQKNLAEVLLEVDGETFSDKLRKVEAANEFVVGQTKILLNLVQKIQTDLDPAAPAPEDTEPTTPEGEETLEEQDMNKALSSREKALEIYAEMAKIKKYFPTVQPLDSEYQLKEVIDGFANVIKIIQDHVATMVRFKDDKNINPSSLESARDGLLTIKKVIMDLFGVADEGKIEAPAENIAAISDTGRAAMEEEGLKEPTPVEVEWDDDEEEEEESGKEQILNNRAAIERHMSTRYLPPEMFKEVFAKNEPLMQSGGKFLEAAYDAFTLFLILTKLEDTEGQIGKFGFELAEADDPGSEVWDELDQDEMERAAAEDEPDSADELGKEAINITKILRGLKTSGIFDNEDMVKDIVYNVMNKHFKQKSKDLSFFFDNAEATELRILKRRLDIQDKKYPFRVVMDSVGSFIKTYADDQAFAPDEETPAGEPEPTPVEVEVDEEALEALLVQAENAMEDPEVQDKIEALPQSGPELIDGLEELTAGIMSMDNWDSTVKQVDLSLPDVNLEPESPEAKQAVADAVEAEIKEKRPEIDLSGVDLSGAAELEPSMDEPAKIDIPSPNPKEIRKQSFNRKMKSIKSKAKRLGARFDTGKAISVIKGHLKDIGTTLKERQVIKTYTDLQQELVDAGAIDADENSYQVTMLVVDALETLGIRFLEPERKSDIEEQLAAKLAPIIKEILNRTNNG